MTETSPKRAHNGPQQIPERSSLTFCQFVGKQDGSSARKISVLPAIMTFLRAKPTESPDLQMEAVYDRRHSASDSALIWLYHNARECSSNQRRRPHKQGLNFKYPKSGCLKIKNSMLNPRSLFGFRIVAEAVKTFGRLFCGPPKLLMSFAIASGQTAGTSCRYKQVGAM